MYQFFVAASQIHEDTHRVFITGSDVNHIKNVLRMKPGEEISVSNGEDGQEYRCGILLLEDEMITCELRFIKKSGVELPAKVYLFQGLPKSDKMEFIIQKAVELGVYEVIPVAAARCVVKLDEKKSRAKIERWQQISEAAAKQSKRDIIPTITSVMTFREALQYAENMDIRLIPYELAEGMERTKQIMADLEPGQRIAVFIGPEGGFEDSEIASAREKGVEPVTLGKRILRTETAGLVVLSWIMYRLE